MLEKNRVIEIVIFVPLYIFFHEYTTTKKQAATFSTYLL